MSTNNCEYIGTGLCIADGTMRCNICQENRKSMGRYVPEGDLQTAISDVLRGEYSGSNV